MPDPVIFSQFALQAATRRIIYLTSAILICLFFPQTVANADPLKVKEQISCAEKLADTPAWAKTQLFLDRLETVEPHLKIAFLDCIYELDSNLENVIPALLHLLADTNRNLAAKSFSLLETINHPLATQGLNEFAKRINSEDDLESFFAMELLVFSRKPELREAADNYLRKPLPELRQKLAEGGELERIAAARYIGRIGELGAPAVEDLKANLQHASPWVRQINIWALGRIGPAAAVAIAELMNALDDPHRAVRVNAALSLGYFDNPEIRAALERYRLREQRGNARVPSNGRP